MKRSVAEAHSVHLDQNGSPRTIAESIYYRIRQATAQQVALILSRVPPIVVKRGWRTGKAATRQLGQHRNSVRHRRRASGL